MQLAPFTTPLGPLPAGMAPAPAAPARAAAPQETAEIRRLVARFAPITLAEMDAVALQSRTDTKYLLGVGQLAQTLRALAGQYRVLEIDGARLNAYQTLYFDTPDFALYLQHHAGKGNRVKVRSRRYLTTGQSFLEVKLKTNKGRTVKRRVATDAFATGCTPQVAGLLAAHAPGLAAALGPTLWNEYTRITLVSTAHPERLTIDLGLSFSAGGRRVSLPGLAIAEVKQDGVDRASGFIQHMQAAGIQPTGFSKYCIGVAMLYPHVKHNNFKPRLRLVEKLIGEPSYV